MLCIANIPLEAMKFEVLCAIVCSNNQYVMKVLWAEKPKSMNLHKILNNS